MIFTYSICYSCYEHKMQILINSEPLSPSSAILQYTDEPFYVWCSRLPELLYRENEEDYYVEYCGRLDEAEILKSVFGQYVHCNKIMYMSPEISADIQERMISLNKIIAENKTVQYSETPPNFV